MKFDIKQTIEITEENIKSFSDTLALKSFVPVETIKKTLFGETDAQIHIEYQSTNCYTQYMYIVVRVPTLEIADYLYDSLNQFMAPSPQKCLMYFRTELYAPKLVVDIFENRVRTKNETVRIDTKNKCVLIETRHYKLVDEGVYSITLDELTEMVEQYPDMGDDYYVSLCWEALERLND